MTELRQRMLDAMVQRGFAPSTQAIYVGAIRRMAKHYRRDPATYTQQEVQTYLLHMVKDEKLSYSSMNQAACAVQFLFQNVLGHTREHFHVPFAKVPAKQPELLAREEISRVLVACWRPERPHVAANRLCHWTACVRGLCTARGRYRQRPRAHVHPGELRQRR